MLLWKGKQQTRTYILLNCILREEVLSYFHEPGHLGVENLYSSFARYVYWPGIYNHVEKYVASCDSCQTNKGNRTLQEGTLQLHDIPDKCWEKVDFLTEFPMKDNGFNDR